MPRIDGLIDAYIDANLLIAFAYLLWRGYRALRHARQDFRAQLRIAEGSLAVLAISPVLGLLLVHALCAFAPGATINMTDLALAQFLNGRVEMEARSFESIISLRFDLVEEVAMAATPFAWAVIGVFCFGFVWAAMRLGRDLLALRGVLCKSYRWRRFGRLSISLSDEARIPFSTRGPWLRHVVLPSGMLAEPERLRIALSHELQHMRRSDVEIEILLSLIQPLFFWNPAFLMWRRDISDLRELACDQALIARRRVTRAGYAECLIAACHTARGAPDGLHTPAVPFLKVRTRRNHQLLRRRIAAICDAGKTRGASPFCYAAGAMMLAVVVLFASSLQRTADWSQDRLMLSTVVNLERLELRTAGLSLSGY